MKKWIKKIDKIVTSAIIGWAVVSIFGLSRTKKWKKLTSKFFGWVKNVFKWWYSLFWRSMAKVVGIFSKKK